jgi:hypothetical protein
MKFRDEHDARIPSDQSDATLSSRIPPIYMGRLWSSQLREHELSHARWMSDIA